MQSYPMQDKKPQIFCSNEESNIWLQLEQKNIKEAFQKFVEECSLFDVKTLKTYLLKGEKIFYALHKEAKESEKEGKTFAASIADVRNLYLYLQCKAAVKYYQKGLDPSLAFVVDGMLVVCDPTGKITKFFTSNKRCYDRISKHFNERIKDKFFRLNPFAKGYGVAKGIDFAQQDLGIRNKRHLLLVPCTNCMPQMLALRLENYGFQKFSHKLWHMWFWSKSSIDETYTHEEHLPDDIMRLVKKIAELRQVAPPSLKNGALDAKIFLQKHREVLDFPLAAEELHILYTNLYNKLSDLYQKHGEQLEDPFNVRKGNEIMVNMTACPPEVFCSKIGRRRFGILEDSTYSFMHTMHEVKKRAAMHLFFITQALSPFAHSLSMFR